MSRKTSGPRPKAPKSPPESLADAAGVARAAVDWATGRPGVEGVALFLTPVNATRSLSPSVLVRANVRGAVFDVWFEPDCPKAEVWRALGRAASSAGA